MGLAIRNEQQPESLAFDSIAGAETAEQAIDRWLDVVARLSRINERDRDELKDELGAHLHDRVRDLELSGIEEHTALRRAIAELGDAAQLARSISEAHRYPRRRIIMNCTLVGLGLAALGVGLVSFNGANAGHAGRAFKVAQDVQVQEALPQKTDIAFRGVSIEEAIKSLDAMTDRSIYVHWNELSDHGVVRDDPELTINLELKNVSLGRAMELMLAEIPGGEYLAWRADDDLIELGVRETFDRRDAQLVSYDISATLQTLLEEYGVEYDEGKDNVTSLLTAMVEPENWEDMGGEIARYNVVGGTMFIQAPPRMHERVQWLLNELESDAGVAMDRDHDPGDGAAASGVFESGDNVTIEVFELFMPNQWTARSGIVTEGRSIRFPKPLGEIEVLGKTPDEVEATIAEKLADVIVDPLASVYHTPPMQNEELAKIKQEARELDESLRQVMAQLDTVMATNRALREELQRVKGTAADNNPVAGSTDK